MTHAPTLTSRGRHPATLSFRPHDDGYDAEIVADGLAVRCAVRCLSAGDGLPAFVDGLAERFRGWDGVRIWRSLEDHLTIEARWGDGGHVVLDVRLSAGADAAWEVRTAFTVDAGAQMLSLAADLAEFFGIPGTTGSQR